ncbi:restriction endonuclease [Chitinophaga niabensis]|uniref:Restriction endonuclease n=1 Tax=Chitinophaga niabensis TaxID=536979 RepID=A0A1N6IX29_9BACT|nr:restriction endonuclease [Chitinophaga niabensis]SIO36476.1 Restriction endonuclease [Chitinophaga niabensis]
MEKCFLKIGAQVRAWEYGPPAFLQFLFAEDSFYKEPAGKAMLTYKKIGYTSTCGKALERFSKDGFDWQIMEKVYASYYDELYENFANLLEYHVTTNHTDWEDEIQKDYIRNYLNGLSKLSKSDQLKDFKAFYVPMLLAESGEKTSIVKSKDGEKYTLKKYEHRRMQNNFDYFLLDRYLGLPPWILLIAGLFTNRNNQNWNFDEVISAMDIKLLLEGHPPETTIDLNLSGIIHYDHEIEGLHERLTKRLVNKLNLYGSLLRTVIEKDVTARNIHLKMHVKETLATMADRKASNDLKGKILEELMSNIFSNVNGFHVTSTRISLGDEEIDLVLRNNINRPFWMAFGSPLIFAECKNWSKKVGASEFRDFEGKLRNHKSVIKLSFFISYMGFSSEVESAIKRSSQDGAHIVLIQGSDLKQYVESDVEVLDWLENLATRLY